MTVPAIGAIGAALPALPTVGTAPLAGPDVLTGATGTAGSDFAATLAQGVDSLQSLQSKADTLAVQAATGDLKDIHDYTIAATQASLATDLTVALRNKAVEAFNEILRMPV